MRLGLKGYKGHQGRDGEAFTTTLTVDGQAVAIAENDGRGGCTHYSELSFEGKPKGGAWTDENTRILNRNRDLLETAFREAARELGFVKADGEYRDSVVSLLRMEQDYLRYAKGNARKGFPLTVVVIEGFSRSGSDLMGYPYFEGDALVVGLRTEAGVPQVVAQYPKGRLVLFNGVLGTKVRMLRDDPAAEAWMTGTISAQEAEAAALSGAVAAVSATADL